MLPVASEELCGMSLKTETLTLEELTLRVVRPDVSQNRGAWKDYLGIKEIFL